MEMALEPSALSEWKRSWTLVLAATSGFSIGSLTTFSFGAFIVPLETEFGWSRASTTSGLTIALFLAAFLTPFAGMAIDRFGPRPVAILGVSGFCCALALLSQITPSIVRWWALWIA